jgi:tRNA (guanine-N7-)-methyltransferase
MPFENPYKSKILTFQDFVYTHEQVVELKGNWKETIFKNSHPLRLEIGTGYGDFMMSYGKAYDNCNFIGMDFRIKRSFLVAKKLEIMRSETSPNFDFRFLALNAENIQEYFGKEEISEVFYFFPDPWPKLRHHRRRLFQKDFLEKIHPLLAPQAKFWIKTDDAPYFQWMLNELKKASSLFEVFYETENIYNEDLSLASALSQQSARDFLCQFPTKFEKLFLGQNKTIKALGIQKI